MQVNVISYSLKELFEKAKNVLVVLNPRGSEDNGALAASLVEIFTGYNKKVDLFTREEIPLAARPLVKSEQIKTNVEPKSLVISFDWTKMDLDKVSYQLDGDRFDLIIKSKSGKLEPKDARFSYKGSDWDLIVTIGVSNIDELMALGFDQDSFNRLPSINFDKSSANTNFAKLNIVNPKAESLCSLAVSTFKEAGIKLPTRAAETMLYGIRTATNNFTQVSDPATFEAAAYCKRSMIPGMVNEAETPKSEATENQEKNAPEAWLAPKIFRSNRVS